MAITTDQYRNLSATMQAMTDADLSAAVSAVTVTAIPNETARAWLRSESLWYRSGPTDMSGAFQAALDASSLPQSLVDLLGEFWAAIFGGASETLATDTAVVALQFSEGMAGLQSAGLLTADQITEFQSFGGGLAYGATTEAEITTVRADVATEDAAQAVSDAVDADVATQQNETINPAIATSDRAAIAAAWRAAATALEVV
jgi:hypothetical protein